MGVRKAKKAMGFLLELVTSILRNPLIQSTWQGILVLPMKAFNQSFDLQGFYHR